MLSNMLGSIYGTVMSTKDSSIPLVADHHPTFLLQNRLFHRLLNAQSPNISYKKATKRTITTNPVMQFSLGTILAVLQCSVFTSALPTSTTIDPINSDTSTLTSESLDRNGTEPSTFFLNPHLVCNFPRNWLTTADCKDDRDSWTPGAVRISGAQRPCPRWSLESC